MNWLKRVFRSDDPSPIPAASADPADLLRQAYELECQGDAAGAEPLYRQLLERDPVHTDALYLLGGLAMRDKREDEAIELFRKAAEHRPQEMAYLFALGNALVEAERYPEAAEIYDACLAQQPNCTEVRNNFAVALIELDRREEAIVELERLRDLMPDVSELHFNLAGIYREYGRTDEAIAAYRRALELKPGHAPTYSNLLLELNYSAIEDAAAIFAEHRRFGELFATRHAAPVPDPAWPRPLRIGYISPDFRNHVVMRFMEPVLANHDRKRFEIFCYHTDRRKDPVTDRLRALAIHWADCEELSNAELADRIRADRIDILVDLAGHTAGNSLPVLATKPAPIQATYLGYPNTTGLGAVDFRITDAYADPPGESDRLSVEQLVRLPGSYFCYRPGPVTPDVGPLPALKSGAITFGCFNNFAKLSGPFLDAAAQVLAAVPGSRLLIKARALSVAGIRDSIHGRFKRAGIDPQRVELRGWEVSGMDHLSIYGAVDIALDSFPYNGATTTCEAMWMGVPVVTLAGDRHAGRAGSSLLNAVGLRELVAHDARQYVAICARLAGDLSRLAEMRSGFRDRMRRSSIMDEEGLTRNLERCYLDLWQKCIRSRQVVDATGTESAAERMASARNLREAGKLTEARAECEKVLRERPDHLDALTLLWDLGFDSGAPGMATDWLNRAIAADGGVEVFHYMLGCVLQAQGKMTDAIAAFRQSLALDPAKAKTHNNLGCVLEAVSDFGGAAECYREAIRLEPGLAQALYNLGNLYKQAGQSERAAEHIGRAVAADPGHADWHCNLGELCYQHLQLDEAIAHFRATLEIDPRHDRAHAALAGALLLCGRVDDASVCFGKALELQPNKPEVESWSLLSRHYGHEGASLSLLEEHLSWAERHARGLARSTAHGTGVPTAGRRLNVGYVSPDFMRHPVGYFIESVLAAHDRQKFNVFAYMTSKGEDDVTRRLRGQCEYWRDISLVSDENAADRIRADGIDILVDLAGHTAGGRLLLFARKPAPIQVSWLGYPDTTGLATMDYRLTDAVADPVGETERFHTEKLVRLPGGFLCYAPDPESPELAESPQVKAGHVTFGCFNNLAKVTSSQIVLWAEILRARPEARLVLKAYGLSADSARRDLRQQFLDQGIARERVELCAPEFPIARHLAKYQAIDIGLDTFPYNGTTTTCEALWMGVPVVTLAGNSHASRTGASILSSVGLPELVAETPAQYVEIALALADDLQQRLVLRAGMRKRMLTSSLMDAPRFAHGLEAAYRDMWEQRLRTFK
jgi:predicted O-linked N-acetylglucosamine transferase (SPINDLY family)